MNSILQDQIMANIAKKMAEEIDRDVMDSITMEILTKDGWTQTNINPAFSEYGMTRKPFEDWYSKTAAWINSYVRGEYKLVKGQWLFKDPRDATMFILKWSS